VGLLGGGNPGGLLPLGIAALSLFWLRTPVESWVGGAPIRVRTPDESQFVRKTVLFLVVVSVVALTWLFWGGRNGDLLGIGGIAAAAFLLQAIVRRTWRSARTAAQMIGAAGLTSTGPAAYYVVTGRLDRTAWFLWAANLLFAANQIHFVQVRIQAAKAKDRREKLAAGGAFFAGQWLLLTLLLAAGAFHVIHWYAAIAFLPILFRGFAWFAAVPRPLAIHALGKSELAYACAFGVLLVAGIGLL